MCRADAGLDDDDPHHDDKLVAAVAAQKEMCTGAGLCRPAAAAGAGEGSGAADTAEFLGDLLAHARALGAHDVPDYPRLRARVAALLARAEAGNGAGAGWDWEAEGVSWGLDGTLSLSPPGQS